MFFLHKKKMFCIYLLFFNKYFWGNSVSQFFYPEVIRYESLGKQ